MSALNSREMSNGLKENAAVRTLENLFNQQFYPRDPAVRSFAPAPGIAKERSVVPNNR